MLEAATRYLRAWARTQEARIPGGFSWPFVLTVDITMVVIGVIATLQRPMSDWPAALLANAIAIIPWAMFFLFKNHRCEGPALWAAWTAGAAILLFGTSTPIRGDFAPFLLGVTVGVVGAITSLRGGMLAAMSAAALLTAAAVTHRIETPALYLTFVGIGWLIGYLVRSQQILLVQQREAQAQLAAHAAADERRRIAREVHDVIAHSLSITLLHLTGARHALQHDGDETEAVSALQQAERLGRQAMDDIRHTVGLLAADAGPLAPEPGIADITTLADDFARAGLDVSVEVSGRLEHVSAAAGLALYRIAQESLSNIAKHAPGAPAVLTLSVSRTAATLVVINELPRTTATPNSAPGRGIRGMRQRIELLGGTVDIGPGPGAWSVQTTVPSYAANADLPARVRAS
jgi:signal transduction histidine kinase